MLAPVVIVLPFIPSSFERGFVTGAGVVAVAATLTFWIVQVTGSDDDGRPR